MAPDVSTSTQQVCAGALPQYTTTAVAGSQGPEILLDLTELRE